MRKAKLLFAKSKHLLGMDVKLVDAETGEELTCISDIRINCPMQGIVTANVDVVISEVEVMQGGNV